MKDNNSRNYLVIMPLYRDNVKESYIFPLGIPYISSALKAAGFTVFTLNLNHSKQPYDLLKETIISNNIQVVLTGGNSPQFNEVKAVFDIAKEVDETIVTVCGGGLISSDPLPAMEALETVDFGIIGEGEESVVELCHAFEKGTAVNVIRGIVYGDQSSYIITNERKAIADIDALPWPDYEGFDFHKFLDLSYIGTNGMNFSRAAMIITSRSCPYSCTFCFHTSGKKYRQRDLEDVFQEIEFLYKTYDIGFLYVLDELFSMSEKRVEEFCNRIQKYNIPWNACLRVDGVNKRIVQLMKEANCFSISFGIESADNSILKSMKKFITIEKIEAALEIARGADMNITGSLIFGDKNETLKTAQHSISWWKEHTDQGLHMKMILPFPGTALYFDALERGVIADSVQYLKDGCPPVNISKMTDNEMSQVVRDVTFLPYEMNPKVEKINLISSDRRTSICTLGGICSKCGNYNIWENVQLFTANYLSCFNCHETLSIDIPKNLTEVIDSNFKMLLTIGKKIGLWGMANYSLSFLDQSSMMQDKNVTLIDLSPIKQLISIRGKQVMPPEAIPNKKIDLVIILAPLFFASIKSLIDKKFYDVEVISIYSLFHQEFQSE